MFVDARIAMTLVADDGSYLRANPAFCRMLGYREEELLGRRLGEFTHPDERDAQQQLLQRLRAGVAGGIETEQRYLARDGRVIWALVNLARTSDRVAFIVQVQDISERKRAEAAIAEERNLLRALLETTHDQVYFKDLESRFVRVSGAQASKLGFDTPEELIGKTDFDVFSAEHAREAFADEQRIIRTGEPMSDIEERETWADIHEAWVSTSKFALRDERGEVIGTFGISRDITKRKRTEEGLRESEERWRSLLANAQEMIVVVDGDGGVAYCSPSIQRWLGYDADELVALPSHPADEVALARALADVTPDGPVWLAHRLRHRDGSWHAFESSFVSLREQPVVGAVLITSRDVTDRLALEQERERLDFERRVSQRLQAVGQLAAGIAHEINTPVQFVGHSLTFLQESVGELRELMRSYREWLLGDEDVTHEHVIAAERDVDLEYLDERMPAAFDRALEGVARVAEIVQGMRRFAHPSSDVCIAPADLAEAIETTLAVCRSEYKYVADVTLSLEELPPVTCNVGDLNQVFLNLIVNAAHAIADRFADSEQRGAISISTRALGDYVMIEIADNGAGIPPDVQDRMYEPFFTTKDVGRGSGQGLAIARTIVEQHAGALECASAPGAGTCFTITLPRQPPAAEAA
jgi:two-component system NtrC family sensor kinase